MRRMIDLNCAPIDQYPVIKKLTKSDMTTSQLVLPRHSVEEFIIPNMPDVLKQRLKEGDGRANIWVVDDQLCSQHFLTMVDRDHRYSIISWGHVRQNRTFKDGQEMRFGWMDEKLHFIVTTEGVDGEEAYFADNDDTDEEVKANGENHEYAIEQPQDTEMEDIMDERPAKRMKTDKDNSSMEEAVPINP